MKRLSSEDRAGLYITAIIHLAVIIVLLAAQIGFSVQRENTFVMDFTRQEQKQQEKEKIELTKSAAQKLEELIAAASMQGGAYRNVTVNRSQALKDDRNTDAEKLYRDAERLARELKDGQNRPDDPDDYVDTGSSQKDEPEIKKQTYSGPSVLSWSLEGRKASRLPIPAYRCMGAGQVTVIIVVNNNGDVVNAKVEDSLSSADECLRGFPKRAARLSKFSASQTAPSRQTGNIVYQFIAQ